MLEKESFEHVFLNEFLAKESTSVPIPKATNKADLQPATPLSSRALRQQQQHEAQTSPKKAEESSGLSV